MTYAMLLNASHNRIYFESAKSMAAAELAAMLGKAGCAAADFRAKTIAGIDYLLFDCPSRLDEAELAIVARSSSFLCLFAYHSDTHLEPIFAEAPRIFDDSINTILKYQGKTNELFTRLMVNLAWSAGTERPGGGGERLTLLDPLCGKGTTLFEGVIWGWDVIGVDTNATQTLEIKNYFSEYLKRLRVHHSFSRESRGTDGKKALDIVRCEYSADKSALKRGEANRLTIATGDCAATPLFIKGGLCDMLVSDLPYGVQHAAKTVSQNKVTALSRSASDLVERALPAWKKALRKGAGIALAFNELTTKKNVLANILEAEGIKVMDSSEFNCYAHRVDQSINRDVIVGVYQ